MSQRTVWTRTAGPVYQSESMSGPKEPEDFSWHPAVKMKKRITINVIRKTTHTYNIFGGDPCVPFTHCA